MTKPTLSLIRDLLEKDGLKPVILTSSADLPFPHLELPLSKDYKQRHISLIFWIESQDVKNPVAYLQMFFLFPFTFNDDALPSTARYLHMLNKTIAFPGFGLSEPDHTLYFKYSFPLPESQALPQVLKSFVGLTEFLYDTYAPNIEEIASGQKSFTEIVRI